MKLMAESEGIPNDTRETICNLEQELSTIGISSKTSLN